MTIVARFNPDSEIAKLKALGLKEREPFIPRIDEGDIPSRKTYEHQFKTIKSSKRVAKRGN